MEMKKLHFFVRSTLVLVAFWSLVMGIGAASTTTQAASVISSLPNGYAFAAYAVIPAGSGTIISGPLTPSWLGCRMDTFSTGNTSSSLTLNSYAVSGAAQTSISNTQTASSATVQTTVNVQNLSMLSGEITAASLRGVVSSTINENTASSQLVDGSITGLNVAGKAITITPGANTTINIANLGTLILNEHGNPSDGQNMTAAGINLMDLHIGSANNSFGLPVGAQFIIGQANSSEQRVTQNTLIGGQAYSLDDTQQASSGSGGIGKLTATPVPCGGGNSTSTLAGASYPGLGSVGALTATATGQETSLPITATTTAEVQSLNLLTGLIQGSQINATANVSQNSASGTGSTSVTLTNVSIGGIPALSTPAPNTRLPLLGVGYVVLNESSTSSNASGTTASVNAIDVYVTVNNAFNLPIGTQLIIGHADANSVNLG